LKSTTFNCLQDQLLEFARQSQKIPIGVAFGNSEATEAIFTTLFPKNKQYTKGYTPGIDEYSCADNARSGGKRSVEVARVYRIVEGSELLPIVRVRITDEVDGTEHIIPVISNLLRGQLLIDEHVARIRTTNEQVRIQKSRLTTLVVTMIVLGLAAYLIVR
jgi:hypothetical protein